VLVVPLEQTNELVLRIHRETGIALRGDAPQDMQNWQAGSDGFDHAIDLVKYIRQNFPNMSIGVAGFPEGHPEMPNRLLEIDYLKQKVDVGADYIVTQLFFDNRDFYDFCERCELAGIDIPIVAGIMPLRTRQGMARMAELAVGARFPAPLLRKVSLAVDDQEVEKIGIDWAAEQARDLIANKVSGVHFYTLNSSVATLEIFTRLGLDKR